MIQYSTNHVRVLHDRRIYIIVQCNRCSSGWSGRTSSRYLLQSPCTDGMRLIYVWRIICISTSTYHPQFFIFHKDKSFIRFKLLDTDSKRIGILLWRRKGYQLDKPNIFLHLSIFFTSTDLQKILQEYVILNIYLNYCFWDNV